MNLAVTTTLSTALGLPSFWGSLRSWLLWGAGLGLRWGRPSRFRSSLLLRIGSIVLSSLQMMLGFMTWTLAHRAYLARLLVCCVKRSGVTTFVSCSLRALNIVVLVFCLAMFTDDVT